MSKSVGLPGGIEAFSPREQGFFPVVFFGQWRVAVLNYCDIVEREKLYRLERHVETDEVFVLQKGQAWLILGGDAEIPGQIEAFPMEENVVYNICKGYWHHIIMTEDASVIIVENGDTGDANSAYANLPPETIEALKTEIQFN